MAKERKLKVNSVTTAKKLPASKDEKYKFQSGDEWRGNAKGRPKGSRNKFAEEFLKDFLEDWEKNGKKAIKACRDEDPVAYVKIAASLLPKDFNLNVTNEKELDKVLDQFTDDELRDGLAAIIAAGVSDKKEAAKASARTKSDSVH